jgi:putative tryptophan/tyrosine transport system substrate-binding protein
VRTRVPLLLITVLLALTEDFAGAQQPTKAPRIGLLGPASPSSPILQSFRQGLRELGYVEGQNIILEGRSSRDVSEYHQGLADELVRLGVDVIVAFAAQPIFAAMKATKTIPIVMTFVGDAASEGFVASLERPGGNVTGVSGLKPELGGKWLELVKETIPSAKRMAVLWHRQSEDKFPVWKSVDQAARSLGVELQWLEVRRRDDIPRSFRSAAWGAAEAFIVLPGGIFFTTMSEIVDLAQKSRLPGISWRGDFVEVGGLMAYGANRLEQSRRAAYVVNKILKGTKPAELPMELPKSFELVINLKTAKEIGIAIPPRVLAWADRVIK